jgi:hypothetical protein
VSVSPLIQHQPMPGWKAGVRFRRRGSLARFTHVTVTMERGSAGLPDSSAALRDGRTVYRSTVVPAEAAPRLLVGGVNQSKIGAKITKGRWAGLPIYTLTLEERATCPQSCHVWRECYGNSMHLARRHAHGPELEWLLGAELNALAEAHPGGFAVRLHVLGDFYSVRYAARWAVWLRWLPQLHVFGFTAWGDDTPIGRMVERMNGLHPDRCAIRFSRAAPSGKGWEAVTIWRAPEGPRVTEGVVCPQQTQRTETCGTCGLCWAESAGATSIVFLGHGRRTR